MNEIIEALYDLDQEYKAGGTYTVLYRIGLVPAFIESINAEYVRKDYEDWLDFNDTYSLDYIESMKLVYQYRGIINNQEIKLYTNHEDIFTRIGFFLCGKEIFTPSPKEHERISNLALRILKDHLTYIYQNLTYNVK